MFLSFRGDCMRKSVIEKKKKFTTNTYMREAIDYDFVIVKEDDLFVTIKKYKKMSSPVAFSDEDITRTYIDEGYYIVELTPLKEHYNIRYYYNEKKELIDYYIDITYKNGVEHYIPYYIDLYLDIIHYPKKDVVKFADEEELLEAYEKHFIAKKDYHFAYKIGNQLMEELSTHTNRYLEIDGLTYINRFFKD